MQYLVKANHYESVMQILLVPIWLSNPACNEICNPMRDECYCGEDQSDSKIIEVKPRS
jgi:hypothetical protein